MKFGSFYEFQVPRPWGEEKEKQVFHEVMDQVELADDLGYDWCWVVEHKFRSEHSHNPAPEVFLAAAARATEQIRLGHGIRLMPTVYHSPIRVAEMSASIDIVSDGRLELGTGESASRLELSGYNIEQQFEEDDPPLDKIKELTFSMWEEATEQVANMMSMEPYPGYDGDHFSMPPRNVIPKPVQKPHPPMWLAVTGKEKLEIAARNGLGALVLTGDIAENADEWVDLYYEMFKEECVPIARAVNPNFVVALQGFGLHPDEREAYRRAAKGQRFFLHTTKHYFGDDGHIPGYTNLWESFREEDYPDVEPTAIGTPEDIRDKFRAYETAGVDGLIWLMHAGVNEHEHLCESLEMFAEEVMPEFKDGEEERQRRKMEELEPYIEEAMERKKFMEPVEPDDLEAVYAFPEQADRNV